MSSLLLSRAAVFTAPAQLRMEEFPLPDLKGREAIVRIVCATICGSDLHTFYGRRPAPVPGILGHEMIGEIVAMGPLGARDFHGSPLSIGDRVTWSMVWSCGSCFYCTRGLRPKCEHLMKYGHEAIAPGNELTGGFAEHCFLREGAAIFRVPDSLSDALASPANCATATVAAVFRHAGIIRNRTVVVIGAGMLGLTACAMSVAKDAALVIAIEPDHERAALARQFGASQVLDPAAGAESLRHQVLDRTAGRGADIVMEFSGIPDAIEYGFQLLCFGGRYLLAGATFPARPVQLSAEQVVRRMIQISGVYNYQPEDLGCALDFLAANSTRFPFQTLTGRSFALDELKEAMEFAESVRPPRVAIVPSHSERKERSA